MNQETIKAKAKALRTFLSTQGLALKHSASLEAIAHIEGVASYNVLQAKPQPSVPGMSISQARTIPLWDVEVCRIGYATAQIVIKGARTRKEAEERALDDAGDVSFSEKSSDYVLVGKEPAEPNAAEDDYADDVDNGPHDWDVSICRTSYGTETLQIEAPTYQDAEEVALDDAGGYEYSITSNKYEISSAELRN